MGRPREHGPEVRAQLLRAAARLLNDEGPAALSVRRLSAEAEVSSRAVYSLFGDMPGLLAELCRRESETMVRRHEAVPRQANAVAEIQALALAYRQAALEYPDLYRLMFDRVVPVSSPSDPDVAYAMRSMARVEDAVTRALRQRRRRRDPHQVTLQLWAVVHGLASLELRGALGDPATAEASWRDTVAAVTAGLFAERRARIA
ncbi:MAG TPA: TetR/AcrR family transcriptional regulator [Jatrophihabitantaceae bacterium]|jgi:AcrR family transcriptional regulator